MSVLPPTRVIIVALFCSAVMAVSVSAEGSGALGFKSDARAACYFKAEMTALSQANMSLDSAGIQQSSVAIGGLIDTDTAKLQRASIHLRIPGLCNLAHRFSISTQNGALRSRGEVSVMSGNFLSWVGYRANATWGAQTLTLTAINGNTPKAISTTIGGAYTGMLDIQISIDETTNDFNTPVVHGIYSDIINIWIGAIY